MKKLALKIIAVVISAAIIYVGIILIMLSLGKVNWLPNVKYPLGGYGHTLIRMQEAKKVKDVDVLFIGSSHVYRGFDVRIFEEHQIKSFNLGSSSQSPFVSYYLLKEHLPQLKPQVIVMDLFWGALSLPNVEAGVDIIANSEVNDNTIDMAWNSRDIILFNSMLLSSIYQSVYPLETSIQQDFKDDKYVRGGFVESLRKQNRLSDKDLTSLKALEIKPSDIQLDYLKKIVALCKHYNVKLLFVVTPVAKEYMRSIVNYNEYSDLITMIAEEHDITLLDYNKEEKLHLDSKFDFYDAHHLTQSGVIKFNNIFIKDLKRHLLKKKPH